MNKLKIFFRRIKALLGMAAWCQYCGIEHKPGIKATHKIFGIVNYCSDVCLTKFNEEDAVNVYKKEYEQWVKDDGEIAAVGNLVNTLYRHKGRFHKKPQLSREERKAAKAECKRLAKLKNKL